jgi:hypothetical protein
LTITTIEQHKPDRAAEILAYAEVEDRRGFWEFLKIQAWANFISVTAWAIMPWVMGILLGVTACVIAIRIIWKII